MIGRTILHYTIIESIRSDDRGQAYLADDPRLRRRVVLVFPDLSEPDARARFLREARAAAKLSHPNIAAVHAVEDADGRVFAALEHVEGDRLCDRMTRGDIDAATALDIAAQVLAALSGAHETSVVHRRLSPDHIVVDRNGRVKVVGFGLSDAEDAPAPRDTPGTSAPPASAYEMPGRRPGARPDHRADLYAFGVILCEMLTGRAPSPGTPADTAGLPDALKKIVEKSIEEDPSRGYESATEILADLARL